MNQINNQPIYTFPPKVVRQAFPTGKGELAFALWILVFSLSAVNGLFWGGISLLFGLSVLALLAGTAVYLRRRGHRFGWYETTLLLLCGLLALSFLITGGNTVSVIAFLLLMTVPGLCFCIAAGQNRRSPGGVLSLLDMGRAACTLGLGNLGATARGFREAFRRSGTIGRTTGAVGIGLLVSIPVLAILIPQLISADAAFEGMLDLLPEWDPAEAFSTAIWGTALALILYARGVALHHSPKSPADPHAIRGFDPLTVNTILTAVCILYLSYLASQLAYFVGGFSGILPEDFTLAEYARRGFFEMGRLCAINLTLMALGIGLVRKEGKGHRLTRWLCLFIGVVTLFFVAAASAKMLLYIRSYGLTLRRVTTEVFMLWLAVTTVLVSIWLFRQRFSYMKGTMVAGLALCALLMCGNVTARVAQYNVHAYQSGRLETVDVGYLGSLHHSAVPYLEELTRDADAGVAAQARDALNNMSRSENADWRHWNLTTARAAEILEKYQPEEAADTQ